MRVVLAIEQHNQQDDSLYSRNYVKVYKPSQLEQFTNICDFQCA